ncbi:MAG TPA: hypothetical protein VNN20_13310 [Thermodesulfobacteriota bacterium]|nr:hypothetical protein [Thermodesulfobacteriota bacterium]
MEGVESKITEVSRKGRTEKERISTVLRTYIARRTLWFSLLLATAILLVAGIAPVGHGQAGGQVESYVFAEVENRQMPLSGVTVFVEDVFTSTPSKKVKTDLNGRFIVPEQPAGTYQLCWEAPGFVEDCSPDLIDIDNSRVFLSPIEINPEGGVVSGHVTMADGTPCHYFDPFFEIDVSASVALVDGMGMEVAGPVLANASGDYLLTSVPSGTFRLRATCEASMTEETLTTSESAIIVKDLTFENQKPIVSNVVTTLNGQTVQGVPRNTTVEVTVSATDADGDSLHYKWATPVPGLTSVDSPTIQWTLPRSRGLHTLYVLVSDGRGGYQMGRAEVSTDGGVVFSSTGQSRTALALSTTSASSSPPSSDNCCTEQNHFLTFNGIDFRSSACAYYEAIGAITKGDKKCDPNSISQPKGITFNEWKSRSGLAVNPDFNRNGNLFDDDNFTGEASALYLNAVDLNLGRSMHGKSGGGKVAYYVCNYPTLKDARRNRNRIACVAMDRSVVQGVNGDNPFTRFYIFGPGGDLRLSVDLDVRGEKFMPGVCTVCHGANDDHARKRFASTTEAGNPDLGGRFLPFDLDNFRYLVSSPSFSRGAQEDKFRRLNQMIKDTNIAPVVRQLIDGDINDPNDGWYPGGTGKQQSDFVPPGWGDDPNTQLDEKELYLNVVKPSCRTCHVVMRPRFNFNRFENLDMNDPNTPPDDTRGSFKDQNTINDKVNATLIRGHVCSAYDMPNSLVTFDRFWLSRDTQPEILAPKVLEEFLQGALNNSNIKCPDPRTVP